MRTCASLDHQPVVTTCDGSISELQVVYHPVSSNSSSSSRYKETGCMSAWEQTIPQLT